MLQALYSAIHQIPEDRFRRRLFWRALPPLVRPLAFCVTLLNPRYFQFDWELLGEISRARSNRELDEELRDFSVDFRNRTFCRRRLHLRVSTRRLRTLTRGCFDQPCRIRDDAAIG